MPPPRLASPDRPGPTGPSSGGSCEPSDRAACLTGSRSRNTAPLARATTLLARHVTAVAHAFRHGGGVPYDQFRPEFTAAMDGTSRGLLDGQLLTGIVPVHRHRLRHRDRRDRR